MAAAPGNKNAAKGREFEQQMRRAILRDDYARVRQGIEKVLDLAAAGERWALEMIRDTMDGRPKQQTEISGPEGGPVQVNTDLGPTIAELLAKVRG